MDCSAEQLPVVGSRRKAALGFGTWDLGFGSWELGVGSAIPAAPLHPVLPAEIAQHAWVDARLACAFGRLVHLCLHLCCVLGDRIEPPLTVVCGCSVNPDAVGFVNGKPRAIAGARR